MPVPQGLPPELDYVLLLFALFVLPRVLQRYGVPPAITSVALGAITGIVFGLFVSDATVRLLATLGIVALFLFAGLVLRVPAAALDVWAGTSRVWPPTPMTPPAPPVPAPPVPAVSPSSGREVS
jgi:thiol:disulfide interchange protein